MEPSADSRISQRNKKTVYSTKLCSILHFVKWLAPVGKDDDRAALFPDETRASTRKIIPEETGNGRRAQYYNQDIPYSVTDDGDMGGSKAAPGASRWGW
jgi:hypothetical protein